MAKTASIQPAKYLTHKWTKVIGSEEQRRTIISFLQREAEMDKLNYAEMLRTVDPESMTKGKIKALSLLGGQYAKASKSLIKDYNNAVIRDWMKGIQWNKLSTC